MRACVMGGGSWGSAFALHLSRKKIKVKLWIREKNVFEEAVRTRENRTFLPGFAFPETVSFHHDIEEALAGTDIVFVSIPSKFCRQMYIRMAPFLSKKQILVNLTKGIEEKSLKRMSEIMMEIFSERFDPRIAVLSGPSFALEVAQAHPTVVVVAADDIHLAKKIQHFVSNLCFRIYTTDDMIGVELAGALKNIIAIATGISAGLDYGSNTMAALVTRGIAEITRLGLELGARQETFAGLAGVGDVVLTCTGRLSRNRTLGEQLGKGIPLEKIVSGMKMVAEGITTSNSARLLAKQRKVEMPICDQVYHILHENKNARTALNDLMSRKLKNEYFLKKGEL